MGKKYRLISLLLLIILIISGCWDRREVEDLGLVEALGLDQGPDDKGVVVTVMIAIPAKATSGGGQSGAGGQEQTRVLVTSVSAPTIYEGFNLLNTTIDREITLRQTTILIISEDLAKKGIDKMVDTLVRFREMRRTLLMFVCQDKAAEVMHIKPKLETDPAKYLANLVRLSGHSGMYPMVLLNDFMVGYETFSQENYLPYLIQSKSPDETGDQKDTTKKSDSNSDHSSNSKGESGKTEIKIGGTAIFKKGKLVGIFNNYESQALLLVNGQFREGLMSIQDPRQKDDYIAFRLLATRPPQIKYKRQGGADRFRVKLILEADLYSIQSRINYTTPKMELIIGRQIARELQTRIKKAITKAQQEYQSDVFGFGQYVRTHFLTIASWNRYHWLERFSKAQVDVAVKVWIRRVGIQFQPPIPKY